MLCEKAVNVIFESYCCTFAVDDFDLVCGFVVEDGEVVDVSLLTPQILVQRIPVRCSKVARTHRNVFGQQLEV